MVKLKLLLKLFSLSIFFFYNTVPATEINYKQQRSISIAYKFIGKGQYNHYQDINKFLKSQGYDINIKDTNWCAAFANSVLKSQGYGETHSLMAKSFSKYGHNTANPIKGDIVILNRGQDKSLGHVGFYWSKNSKYVFILGGNEDKQVKIKAYPISKVYQYRHY